MKCKKCSCEEMFLAEKKGVTSFYCTKCQAWQKIASKAEQENFKSRQPLAGACYSPIEAGPCEYCAKDYVIPTAWGDGGIRGWINIPAVICPVCGRKI